MRKLFIAVSLFCVALMAQANNAPAGTNCEINPFLCQGEPVAKGCQPGHHWTLQGTNLAHCVRDDFACGFGQHLEHDNIGNPYCVANSCPAGQQLQADGVSCACPSGTTWNGSSCVVVAAAPPAQPVPVITTQYNSSYVASYQCKKVNAFQTTAVGYNGVTYTISNSGTEPLNINRISYEADPFGHVFATKNGTDACTGRSLAKGQSCTFMPYWTLPYEIAGVRYAYATLTIHSNAGATSMKVEGYSEVKFSGANGC